MRSIAPDASAPAPRWLNAEEVSVLLGVPTRRVYQLADAKVNPLPCTIMGQRKRVFPYDGVTGWMRQRDGGAVEPAAPVPGGSLTPAQARDALGIVLEVMAPGLLPLLHLAVSDPSEVRP